MARLIHCAECGRNRLHQAKGLCKQCHYRQWYETHKEQKAEYGRQRRKAKPEKVREAERRWRKANPSKVQAQKRREYERHQWQYCERSRQWNKANKQRKREQDQQYHKANPEKRREGKHRRRALMLGATIGPVDVAAIYERDGHMCMYCGTTHKKLTIDHIVALNNGGSHCEDSVMAACGHCNFSKGAKSLEDWLQTQPYSIVWLF